MLLSRTAYGTKHVREQNQSAAKRNYASYEAEAHFVALSKMDRRKNLYINMTVDIRQFMIGFLA